ncbi:MAG: metal-dependent hydrolase [Paenibacillaceae bacterium]
MSKLKWVGHSTVILETNNGLVIVIDPWIKGNPMNPVKELPGKVDVILITHDHSDHVGDAIELSINTGAKVIAQPETISRLNNEGLPAKNSVKMNIGGTFSAEDFKATMVHAFHTSATGAPTGYMIQIDGKIVYHLGDTGLFGDLRLFGELYDIDYALIPVGGHFTMDYKHGCIAATLLNAKKVIPTHYGTFPILLQDANLFVDELKSLNHKIEVLVLDLGESIEL